MKTALQSVLIRIAAIAVSACCVAGCAGVPADSGVSLPDKVIVNDPAADLLHEELLLEEPQLPPALPVPEHSAPIDDAGPPEPIIHGDVFDRIRRNLELPDSDHRRVQSEIAWMQRNSDYLARTIGRAQRYLHYIVDEVEARGLPGDLALLPIVESAFNPFG
ncbi:MAG: hypothetical protein WAW79_09075, partial [Steroidobacteraceae bacterium]